MELQQIAVKWQKKWEEGKAFEARPDKRPKFFVTFPYPYMNGYLHVGHFYSLMRVEAMARYKRLRGFNVLFPQGWHCTGSPIEAAAKRIREKEEKQLKIMKDMGFSDGEILKFEKPEYWTTFFPKAAENDYRQMGMSVDFRREFITTSLNPHYNKFIEWQFRKLKEKGYVAKGAHPVVWDPSTNMPVGDHDRIEGEGEVPQEFLLVRHRLDDGRFLMSATLRPDTILGITNLYVNPDAEYEEIGIDTGRGKERWIVGESAVKALADQEWKLERKGKVNGRELIGKETEEIGKRKVMILPATFLDPKFGTGLVHSVPSESADDLIALYDLQKNQAVLKKYNLDAGKVRAIKPIGILETEGIGGNAAEHFLKKENVKDQNDRKKLERIRKELYKLSFYAARFGKIYKGFFSREITGKPVQKEKDFVNEEIKRLGWGETFYQLTGKVVARSLSECTVKIVKDQWFITYGNEAWKKEASKALAGLQLYPEKSRSQFEYVLGWLKDWACVREYGLGTALPWDNAWVIESLSDSTIYMAYYTISHLLQQIPAEKINDDAFDYVFLGRGAKPDVKNIDEMRKEFQYWYPLDYRNSGKDLIQNHLAFFLFNHVAIFPEKHWPKGIGVNGFVAVDGEKMSKSKGNFILLKDMAAEFTPDAARFTAMYGGEGLDDANFDREFAKSLVPKLLSWFESCTAGYGKGKGNKHTDAWLVSELNKTVRDVTKDMELTLYRSALQKAFFDMTQKTKWYLRRTAGKPNNELIKKVIEAQAVMMAPFTPFICEEIWEKLGKKGFICNASWPKAEESLIDEHSGILEQAVSDVLHDIHVVKKLSKLEAKNASIIVAHEWKYPLAAKLANIKTRNPKELIGKLMEDAELRKHGKEVSQLAMKAMSRTLAVKAQKSEIDAYEKALAFLEKESGCKIEVIAAERSTNPKAGNSLPGKPAIVVS